MKVLKYLILAVLLSVLQIGGVCQQGLKVFDNALSHVTGQSNLAAADLLAISLNAAALDRVEQFYLSAGAMQSFLIKGLYHANVEAGYRLGRVHSLGLQAGYGGVSNFNEMQLSAGYALRLADRTSIGLRLHGFRFVAPEQEGRIAGTFSLGIRTDVIPRLAIAATTFNPIGFFRKETNAQLSHQIRLGLNYNPADYLNIYLAGHLDNNYPLAVSGGVQYTLNEKLHLYLGACTEPAFLGVGIGYQLSPVTRLDLGATRHLELGFSPAMNILYGK